MAGNPTQAAATAAHGNDRAFIENAVNTSQGFVTPAVADPARTYRPSAGNHSTGDNPLPHHGRDFPKPERDIDMGEALLLEPRPWSIVGQREANRKRADALEARMATQEAQEELRQKKAKELEEMKKELRRMHAKIQTVKEGPKIPRGYHGYRHD